MKRITAAARGADWPREEAVGSVTLTYDDRHRRRMRLTTDQGEAAFVDLGKPFPLASGDGLKLEDGGWLEIRAAREDVLEIAGEDSHHLARLTWHLGHRHVAIMLAADGRVRIRFDPVIQAMMERLGATCERGCATFEPEPGFRTGFDRSPSR